MLKINFHRLCRFVFDSFDFMIMTVNLSSEIVFFEKIFSFSKIQSYVLQNFQFFMSANDSIESFFFHIWSDWKMLSESFFSSVLCFDFSFVLCFDFSFWSFFWLLFVLFFSLESFFSFFSALSFFLSLEFFLFAIVSIVLFFFCWPVCFFVCSLSSRD